MIRLQLEEAIYLVFWLILVAVMVHAIEKDHAAHERERELDNKHLHPAIRATLVPVPDAIPALGELDTPGEYAATHQPQLTAKNRGDQ